MPREIITIGAGQCGNQLSSSFWEKLCLEHGIQADGSLQDSATRVYDRKDVFFYQSDDARYIPRAVMLDLEPRVVQNVATGQYGNIYNPENMFTLDNGSGAGNNWGAGHFQGEQNMDVIMDILEREAENSDSLEAFMLMHSVAGGTGSGLGSVLLEQVRDRFPKTIVQTVSVFPSSGAQASDVVVQPYNSMLALRRLIEHADSVLIFDNNALMRIAGDSLQHQTGLKGNSSSPTLEQTNALVSTALLAATATIRFPGYIYNNWTSVLSALIPVPAYHFLTASYTPVISFNDTQQSRFSRKTTVTEIMRRLIQQKYSMLAVSPTAHKNGRYLALLRVIQGEFDAADYRKRLLGLRQREDLRFAPMFLESAQLAVAKRSPFVEQPTKLNGLALTNSTSVSDAFARTLNQFNRLYMRAAFLNEYRKQPMFEQGMEEFEEARSVVNDIVQQYKEMEREPDAALAEEN